MSWTTAELAAFDKYEELALLLHHEGNDDSLVPVWVVVVDEQVWVRSYHGDVSNWFRRALSEPDQRVEAGGIGLDVTFERTTGTLVPEIDKAYNDKYSSFGESYVEAMRAPLAVDATMRVLKRE